MIPGGDVIKVEAKGVPRVGGGDPGIFRNLSAIFSCSPRRRG